MPAPAFHDADRRPLSAAFRGQRALRGFAGLTAKAGPRLELDGRTLRQPDSFTGVAVREAIDRHLLADRGHDVVLLEPRDVRDFDLLADLLGPLPKRARWAGLHPFPRRDGSVLLPAMRIPDRTTADLLADALPSVTAALRLPLSEARLAATAAAVFADNALIHAAPKAPASLLSICRVVEANDLQVVMLTPSVPPDARTDPGGYLRDVARRSEAHLGGLYSVGALARRRGIDATLRVAIGTGRVYVRSGRPRYEAHAADLPAFVAGLEIHLGSAIRPSV
jgi:hypothetical protein